MYAVLDIEATGGKLGEEKIIDIAIYRFNGEEVVDNFGSMVNPTRSIDKYVQKLTGITEGMVKRAPKFHEIAKRVVQITEGCTIVGHGVSFDYRMLRQEFSELGYEFERNTLDTLELAKELIPDAESYSLGKLCKSLGIPVQSRHRADGDARVTLELFKLLLKKDQEKSIIQSYSKAETSSEEHIKKLIRLKENLPNKTGIFYFHNKKGKIIYFKATKNIASAVNKVFSSSNYNDERIQSLTVKVTFELTGSLLIALLKEKNEQKSIHPIVKSTPHFKFGIYITKDEEGRKNLQVLPSAQTSKIPLLFYTSKRRAKNALFKFERKYKLSETLPIKEQNKIINSIKKDVQFNESSFLMIDKGKEEQEKSCVWVEDKKIKGYFYYTFYNQNENPSIRENLNIPVSNSPYNRALIRTFIYYRKFEKIEILEDSKK